MNLDDLNPAQRAAVLAPDGPILILAGAGSGKTRVLTYRIAHLLAERKAIPEQTLAVTFTNKAASEMRERVATLMGGASRFPWVSTFHSACARILRQEIGALGYDRNFSILDEGDAMAVIRRVLEDAQLADSPPPEFVRARIDQVKNEAMFPEGLAQIAADGRERVIAQLYALYQQRLREMNALDFNDLLLLTHRLFEANPGVLARWQERAAISSSTSTRTRTTFSICSCARSRPAAAISAWSATRTSPSIDGAAPTSATSSISNATIRTRRFSNSSRTIARPKRSSRPPTPLSKTISSASRSGCGPRIPPANWSPTTPG